MNAWIAAAVGGGLGAMLRYGLSGLVQRNVSGALPLGTLVVNVLGCLAAGCLLRWASASTTLDPTWRTFWAVGVLGALTTFSTFGVETFQLVRLGRPGLALASVGLNVVLGLGAVALGWWALGRA